MSFRLSSKWVTLNDLELRNGRVFCVISPNAVAFGAYYEKMVELGEFKVIQGQSFRDIDIIKDTCHRNDGED